MVRNTNQSGPTRKYSTFDVPATLKEKKKKEEKEKKKKKEGRKKKRKKTELESEQALQRSDLRMEACDLHGQ